MDSQLKATMLSQYRSLAGRRTMSSHWTNYLQAVEKEEALRARLANPDAESDSAIAAREQLAEVLIMQGKLEDAIEFASANQLLEIQARQDALDRADDDWCDCEAITFQTEQLWSEQHNAWVYDTICQQCRGRNLTPNTFPQKVRMAR